MLTSNASDSESRTGSQDSEAARADWRLEDEMEDMSSPKNALDQLPAEILQRIVRQTLFGCREIELGAGTRRLSMASALSCQLTSSVVANATRQVLKFENLVLLVFTGPEYLSPHGRCVELNGSSTGLIESATVRRKDGASTFLEVLAAKVDVEAKLSNPEDCSPRLLESAQHHALVSLSEVESYFDFLSASQLFCFTQEWKSNPLAHKHLGMPCPLFTISISDMGTLQDQGIRKIVDAARRFRHPSNSFTIKGPLSQESQKKFDRTNIYMSLQGVDSDGYVEWGVGILYRCYLRFAQAYLRDDGDSLRQSSRGYGDLYSILERTIWLYFNFCSKEPSSNYLSEPTKQTLFRQMIVFAFTTVSVVWHQSAHPQDVNFTVPKIKTYQDGWENDHECGHTYCCPRTYFWQAGLCIDEWQPRSLEEKYIQNLLLHQVYLIDGLRSFANEDLDFKAVQDNLRDLQHILIADAQYGVDGSLCDDFYLVHDHEVLAEMQRKASTYIEEDAEGYELADETMIHTSLRRQPTRILFESPTGGLSIRNANKATKTKKFRLTDLLLPELPPMPQLAAS
ncbi:hypothetical protein KC331_g2004 [Hortaea werneckii]|nr:hypothetical protein KC357_g8988 [Hortaea werneckii]KAI7552263.1 hypothetical protein KC331_g2004 [Hortaea werneckii]KAI7722680.1 hypothetical protein KC353_g285 [Hortaea werneckii]